MGAFTSAVCYRAGGEPPIVQSADLAGFIERIMALDILDGDVMDLKLKFGQAIDQDDRSTSAMEEISPGIALMHNYDWDISESRFSSMQALTFLRHPPAYREVKRQHKHLFDVFGPKTTTEQFAPNLYRAYLHFGMLKEHVFQTLCHESAGNDLHLTDLSFSIDVVELNDPQESDIFQVGWMEFSISGSGYLFPWTYAETVEKCRTHRDLNAIHTICQELWPASAQQISPALIEHRQAMANSGRKP